MMRLQRKVVRARPTNVMPTMLADNPVPPTHLHLNSRHLRYSPFTASHRLAVCLPAESSLTARALSGKFPRVDVRALDYTPAHGLDATTSVSLIVCAESVSACPLLALPPPPCTRRVYP